MNGTATKTAEFDTSAVSYIEKPGVAAWSEAETLAADTRYSFEHRQELVQEALSKGKGEVESRYVEEIKRLDESMATLTQKARQPFLPPADLIPSLNYARDLLAEKVAEMNQGELAALLKTVIEAGEKIAAQAAKDFLPGMIRRKLAGTQEFYAEAIFKPLFEQINELLSTDEQRTALRMLERARITRMKINQAHGQALEKLNAGRVERDKLVERRQGMPRL